jgi:hypothetical protein
VLPAQFAQGGVALVARVRKPGLRGIDLALAPVAVGLPAAAAAAQVAGRRDLDDAVHALEQFAVVARDHHHAAPGREPLAQPAPCIGIEMVAGLVEQQRIGAREEGAGQRDAGALAAAQAVGAPADGAGQARVGERGREARGQVPAAFGVIEIGGRAVAGLDARERGERACEARERGQVRLRRGAGVLRHVHAARGPHDRACRGFAPAREQVEQHRLAGAIAPDQPDAPGLEGRAEIVEQQMPARQREAGVAQLEAGGGRKRKGSVRP